MKPSFSLFEMIIVIVLIAIISSMGIYKLFFTLDNTHELEVKTQVQLIKNAIVQKQNEHILLGEEVVINSLDDASINTPSQVLFSHILQQTILSSSTAESTVAKWIKIAHNQYKINLSKDQSLVFTYDKNNATFECDYNNLACKELYE